MPAPVTLAVREPGLGDPLPAATQRVLEHTLDIPLHDVRVHTDVRAAAAANILRARAFTYGLHVFLGAGESATDVGLMAHEVTHVVQQRGAAVIQTHNGLGDNRFEREAERTAQTARQGGQARVVERTQGAQIQTIPLISDAIDWAGDRISDAIDWIRDRVWSLLERHAPSLVPILRRGVLDWLKEKLGNALEAIIDVVARPVRAVGDVVSGVRQHFGNLVAWLRDAVARIARNDCGPITEAADKIHQVFEGLAAPVVERVKFYAAKVKEFFHGLWERFGAPVWNLLRRIGGAIWEEIERIGRWIWEKTQPVRDWLSRAWRWLKNLIGIGEGEEGHNGILQWFQRKAAAAWDWVMARIGPFKRPLLIIAGVLVMLSPAGPIIAIGVAAAGILRGIQWIRQHMRSRNAVVQQQSFLRGTILPAILGAIDRVSGIVQGIAGRITGALRSVVAGVNDLASAVSSIPLLSFASGLITWLANGFRGLLEWATVGVQGVADRMQAGLQSVGGFAHRLIDFLEEIERLLRNFFRMMGTTFRRIWHAIPNCIRDVFVDFLIPLILRQIPFFRELAATPEAWQQTRSQVTTLLVQVFVDFDLMGAMRTVFTLIVRVLSIPVDLIGQLLDKAAQAWDLVIASPIRFISNALKAILKGVGFFVSNFLSHLWFGIQGWLLNAVSQSGVRPPASWDFRGIFGFVLDVLGISVNHVLDLLATRIDRAIVNRIRTMIRVLTGAWEWVKVAIEEGPAGLWRMVVSRLGDLARSVLEAAVGWVMTRIFAIISARLAALAASAGFSAILEAIGAVYAAIRTAMEYARRIIQMLINVFDGIIQIAGGVLDPAARTLETAFRNAMPIVIGFLANYAGLGGIGGRIQEIIMDVRERVDNAILWLIDRALAAGRWLLDRLRAGVAAVVDWWRARKNFRTQDGAEHSLYFRGEETSAHLMLASNTPTEVNEYLRSKRTEFAADTGKLAAISAAEGLLRDVPVISRSTVETGEKARQITDKLERLAEKLIEIEGGADLPTNYDFRSLGYGSIEVDDLAMNNAVGGSTPSFEPDWYRFLKRTGLTENSAPDKWVRMHMQSEQIGGKGDRPTNLIPAPNSINRGPQVGSFERALYNLVRQEPGRTASRNVIWMKVEASEPHPVDSEEPGYTQPWFFKTISMTSGLKFRQTNAWRKDTAARVRERVANVPHPDFSLSGKPKLSMPSRTRLQGLDRALFTDTVVNYMKRAKAAFTSFDEFKTAVQAEVPDSSWARNWARPNNTGIIFSIKAYFDAGRIEL
jgi:phage-related protein